MKGNDIKRILKGIVFSAVVFCVLWLSVSALCYFSDISEKIIFGLMYFALCASVFAGAYPTAKGAESKKAVFGLSVGLGFFAMLVLGSVLICKNAEISRNLICSLVLSLAAGFAGAMAGR